MQRFSSWFPPQKLSANIEADLPFSRNCNCRRSLRRIPRDFVSDGSWALMKRSGGLKDRADSLSISFVFMELQPDSIRVAITLSFAGLSLTSLYRQKKVMLA
jgi:hypothetical protein